jgi:Na+-driven multidrug efflux pump
MRLQTLWMMPALSIGCATAFMMNRGEAEEHHYLSASVVLITGIYSLVLFLVYFYHEPMIGFLSAEPNIIRIAKVYLHTVSPSYIALALALSVCVILDATGRGALSFKLNLIFLIIEFLFCVVTTFYFKDEQYLFKTISVFNWIFCILMIVYGYRKNQTSRSLRV